MTEPSNFWMPFTQMGQTQTPHMVASAQGATMTLANGKTLIDAVSSWWVTLHGHCQPEIAQAIYHQALKLEQVIAAGYSHQPAQELCRRLKEILPSPLEWVFFSDDGSTAVEVSLKMAFQYWKNQNKAGRSRFLALESGYHGDTVGAMSVGDPNLFNPVFRPLLFDVTRLPCPQTWAGDPEVEQKEQHALQITKQRLEENPDGYAAIILEPLVQGAAGMQMYRQSFLQDLVSLVRSYGVLVIFDEVMTGFGRTGELFACIKAEVSPDIICLSKGLTGGAMPMAVTVTSQEIYHAFFNTRHDNQDRTFYHGHSFTANPLGCAASLASLQLLQNNQRYTHLETWHQEQMENLKDCPRLSHHRILGSIAAMTWAAEKGRKHNDVSQLKDAFFEKGVLLRPLGNELYILPPYCITQEQLAAIYQAIVEVMKA